MSTTTRAATPMPKTVEQVIERAFDFPEYHSPPIGADEDLPRWLCLVRRVEARREAGKISQDWEDIILGRRYVNGGELADLISMHETRDGSIMASVAGGLTGGDYHLDYAEGILDVLDRSGWTLE